MKNKETVKNLRNFIKQILEIYRKKVKRLLRVVLPIVWMILIFYGSSRQSVKVVDKFWLNFFFFKTLHFCEYAVLFFLNAGFLKNKKTALIFTLLYAAFDEIHQLFVPTRQGALRDFFIDTLGAGSVWFLTK